ncbi:MAG: nicotinate-nucleotide--dimethylbenzimidazole phosphoribosyltransferase, partial [Clostridia bacterium]|nr:nicotinate-nucleotide--dimethylbenzimidazole phosphoribosyltransferase [Clostridia bacterium]
MINFKELNNSISPFSVEAARLTRDHWNSIAKPIGSLGLLEEALVQIAGLTGSHRISLEKRAVIVLCADNGVVEEGVTQTDASVTADMAHNISSGNASVCCMAKVANADIITVDIGMN